MVRPWIYFTECFNNIDSIVATILVSTWQMIYLRFPISAIMYDWTATVNFISGARNCLLSVRADRMMELGSLKVRHTLLASIK